MHENEQPENVSSPQLPTQADWPPRLSRLIVAAIVAAGLSFLLLKVLYPIFVLPEDLAYVPEQAPIEVYQKHDRAQYEADGKNFAVIFGLSGAVLGACCVVFAFGMKCVKSIVVAVVASGCFGAVGALLSNWMFNYMRERSGQSLSLMGVPLSGMAQSIVGYSLLWSLIGLGVGVGIGSVRGPGKALIAGVSGLLGGAVASMLYVVLVAQISIGTVMNRVLPDAVGTQLLWLVFFATVTVVCIVLGSGEKKPKSAS